MLEYALLASLIAVVAISSVSYLGVQTNLTFNAAGSSIEDSLAAAGINR